MSNPAATPSYRVLIVEDEFLIADSIARHLSRRGHTVVGKAISYEDARELYLKEQPHIALLDIRLSGDKTGVDVARFLNGQPVPIPFIYLTSQSDPNTVDLAKDTFPSGFLSKPVQMDSMLSMVAITMHNHRARSKEATVTLRDGRVSHVLQLEHILYLQADHVYVHVTLLEQATLVFRSTLGDLIDEIGTTMVQTHRSFAVNPSRVTRYTGDYVYIGEKEIPVSRSRRKAVAERFQA